MALEIIWSKKADKKFDKIIEYLLLNWGENSTKTFIKKVFNFLSILAEFPEIGSIENKEYGIRGFSIVKQINIFYKSKGDKIILLDFYDNRQDNAKKRF
ncbi:MAG: type II toxin-antitoxin system RelE/ParE family toxin [Saprospiraceae bacterium]